MAEEVFETFQQVDECIVTRAASLNSLIDAGIRTAATRTKDDTHCE